MMPRRAFSEKKRSILCTMAELLAADHWAAVEINLGGRPNRRRSWLAAAESSGALSRQSAWDDVFDSLHRLANLHRAATPAPEGPSQAIPRLRQQLMAEPAWQGVDDLWQSAGFADYLVSAAFHPSSDHDSLVVLARSERSRPFTPHDRRVAEIMVTNIPWVHASECLPPRVGAGRLTPRMLETLDHLRAGLNTRRIANAMGISQHTAGDYVKSIYRYFGVSNRAELFARLADGPPVQSLEERTELPP
jgi:DNA-binding CsgD family transcriptional regulator